MTVTFAAEGVQLQLNAFEPIIAKALFESLDLLSTGCDVLSQRCIAGITANVPLLRASVSDSIGIVTAFSPRIGYENASSIAQQALQSGHRVGDIVVTRGLMSADEVAAVLAGNGISS